VKDKVVSYKMGSSKREVFAAKTAADIPGPGIYSSPSKLGNGPKYTF